MFSFTKLGGNPRNQDVRDYKIDSFLGSAIPTPIAYQSPVSTIYMQDKYTTCGGHAPAPAANILFNAVTSPKYAWDQTKEIDGIDPNDGTTMDAIFKSWQQSGICDLSLLDDSLMASLFAYTMPSNITNQMINNAQSKKITNYAFTDNPTIQQIKNAIYKYKAVILLVNCNANWWTSPSGVTSWAESDVLPLRSGPTVDGHFICATGFDEKYIYFANSWSKEWGRLGMGYFDQTYISEVREMGAPIINLVTSLPQPTDTPVIVPQEPQKYVFTSDINYLDTSADVHQLQVRLGVPVSLTVQSGHYGFLTLIAVIAFKIKNNLRPINGIVDINMRTLLNN